MLAEGELRSNMDESDKVRDLQDKVADLKAEVDFFMEPFNSHAFGIAPTPHSNERKSQLLFCNQNLTHLYIKWCVSRLQQKKQSKNADK